MEYGLTQKQEIYLLLYQVIPTIDIIDLIYQYKRQLEDQDNNYYYRYKYKDIFIPRSISCTIERNIKCKIKYHEESYELYKNRAYIKMIGCNGFIHTKTITENNIPNKKNVSLYEKLQICKQSNFSSLIQSYDEYMYDNGGGIRLVNKINHGTWAIHIS